MFPKVSPFISRLLREWLLFKVEEDIEEMRNDIHEMLEWEARHARTVADALTESNHRLSEIERVLWKKGGGG